MEVQTRQIKASFRGQIKVSLEYLKCIARTLNCRSETEREGSGSWGRGAGVVEL